MGSRSGGLPTVRGLWWKHLGQSGPFKILTSLRVADRVLSRESGGVRGSYIGICELECSVSRRGRFIGPTIGRVGVAGVAGELVYRGRERVERKAERTEVEK